MAKDATLGTNLVDRLLPTIGRLRSGLLPKFGVRQFRVTIVRRQWSGGERGKGTSTVISQTVLDPPPLVSTGGGARLLAGGQDEADRVTLSEIDLRYTEGELTGRPILEGEDLYYRIEDANGQRISPRYYLLEGDPEPDREDSIGWKLKLRRVEIQE